MIEFVVAIILVVACFALVCFVGSPYVPTRKEWAKEALNIVKLSSKDLVVDLGAGDGKILRMMAENNVKSIGYELNPILVLFGKISLLNTKLAKIKLRNYWIIDLPKDTTVVYAFMVQRDAFKLEKYLKNQLALVKSKKIKLVTFGFDLPNKKPIKKSKVSRLYIFE